MLRSSYVRAFCLLLILHPEDAGAKEPEVRGLHSWDLERMPEAGRDQNIPEDPKEGRLRWPGNFRGPIASLRDLASSVTDILDRISRKWALEGARTVQNGEIRLRKLNKDLQDTVNELMTNGSRYGRRISHCMNRTIFDAGLDKILVDTTECYSKSLASVRGELRKLEDEEDSVLGRLENFGRSTFEMLSGCFLNDDVADVIRCLQRVDGMSIAPGDDSRAGDLTADISHIIRDIPKAFAECTSRGLLETEEHVRRGYAQSLTCLKDN